MPMEPISQRGAGNGGYADALQRSSGGLLDLLTGSPMDLLAGPPSFKGGAGGSAFAQSSSTAVFQSGQFHPVFGGGSTPQVLGQTANTALIVAGMVALLWVLRK